MTPEQLLEDVNRAMKDAVWGVHDDRSAARAALAVAIEACAKVADDYSRDGRDYKEYACETADELAARIRALLPARKEGGENE
jgi:hypothetical protein